MEDHEDFPIFYDDPQATVRVADRVANRYPGEPLPDYSTHIRLVELWEPLPGTFTLKFRTERLDTAPDFHALSYTWGTTFRRDPLLGLQITDNLFSALLNLAEHKRKLWWIDALCINQQDTKEKNAQVKLMREIYSRAKQVYVWLGEPDPVCIDLLQKIASRVGVQEMFNDHAGFENGSGLLERYGLPDFEDLAWASLMRFTARPYFKRVWVVQELIMAEKLNITVACGRLRFNWFLIAGPIHWIRTSNLQRVFQSQGLDPLQNQTIATMDDVISLSWTLDKRERLRSLEHLLGISSQLESTDPRDKIIALLGLVAPTDPSLAQIDIDYNRSVKDFFRDVTGTIITSNSSLKLLLLCADDSQRNISDLPSWVPDYTNAGAPRYRYAHFSTPNTGLEIEWSNGSNILSFSGRLLDEIEYVSDIVPQRGGEPTETLLAWFSMLAQTLAIDEWDLILSFGDPDSNSMETIGGEFWRCMVADFVTDQGPAPKIYGDHFAAAIYSAFFEQKLADEENCAWLLDFSYSVLTRLVEKDLLMSLKDDPLVILFVQLIKGQETDRADTDAPLKWVLPDAWVRVEDNPKQLILGPPGDQNAFIVEMAGSSYRTSFFLTKAHPVTRNVRMGRGPVSTQPGDRIAIAKGTNQVFILRNDGEYFRLVGECYVDGLMRGEAQEESSAYEHISLR